MQHDLLVGVLDGVVVREQRLGIGGGDYGLLRLRGAEYAQRGRGNELLGRHVKATPHGILHSKLAAASVLPCPR